MRRRAAILLVATFSAPALASEPAWQSTAQPDGTTRLECGADCADAGIICIGFSEHGSKALRVEEIADEALASWAQIDYSTLASAIADRDLSQDVVTGGERSRGPEAVALGGRDWVSARYDFAANGQALSIELRLWLEKSELLGLRCSYRTGNTVDDMIDDLAMSLRS